jgi:hypothetical protein
MTGSSEHPHGQRLAIFSKLEAEIEGEEKTHCPLRTHVASYITENKGSRIGGEGGIRPPSRCALRRISSCQ